MKQPTLDSAINAEMCDPGSLESCNVATPGILNLFTIPLERSPASKNCISFVVIRQTTDSSEQN